MIVAVTAAMAAVDSAAVARTITDKQTRQFALPSGRGLTIELTVGSVRVHGEARSDAVVDITRSAPSTTALARVPVRVDETGQDIHINATQVQGGTDSGIRTDIAARVPHDAALRAIRIMEGNLALSDLRGEVLGEVRRGPIQATALAGTVRLETNIGDITAQRVRLSPDGLLRLRAFNGTVRLALAELPSNARVMALALNGTIQSQIPLNVKDTWGPRWGEATIGNGEPVISIDVVTGRIHITVE